jgi:hypothetical protein
VEIMPDITTLLGKPIDQLTPAELKAFQSDFAKMAETLAARSKEIAETAQKTALLPVVAAYKTAAKTLGWEKFPRMEFKPNEAGDDVTLDYVAVKLPRKTGGAKKSGGEAGGNGSRATGVEAGKITVNKIILAHGGNLDHFEVGGKSLEGQKEVISALVNPKDKDSEANHCWEVSGKGTSISDIITGRHATEVALVFKDGTKVTVADAVKQMTAARQAAAPAATATAEVPV